ncbi:hypothetical protein [Acidovorax sp.]|uniref:hypothetical protein n=1 Tax=Acidovorax sp. TaxID=1872122 RepID=UPI00391F8570
MDAPSDPPAPAAPQPSKLLEAMRQRIRVLHYCIRSEQACVDMKTTLMHTHVLNHGGE